MSLLYPVRIAYGAGLAIQQAEWVTNFLPIDDYSRSVRNVATSGLVETVLESPDVLVSWTIPAMSPTTDYAWWATFYRWAAGGGQFNFSPCYPTSAKVYHATLEDRVFQPKRAGFGRYSLDCKIRIIPDANAPADAGEVMLSFWGLV